MQRFLQCCSAVLLVGSCRALLLKPPSSWLDGLIKAFYPAHYVTRRLGPGQQVTIDGKLDDEAWKGVDFTSSEFVDIAEPRFPQYRIPGRNSTRVKVLWDSDSLYVGAELGEAYPMGTVSGHNSNLNSSRPTYGNVPYFDNDFEVFIDASMSNWYYKEFEMNFLNATYDVLWRTPDGGLGSVGVPCDQKSLNAWCQNTTFTATSAGGPTTWTMFNRVSPQQGMATATSLLEGGWSLEIKFPLRGNAAHGGLIDAEPGVNVAQYDPAFGQRYWWIDFSRAEHPLFNYWLTDKNSSNEDLASLCQVVMNDSPELLGTDKWSCYWEWTWQAVGGHRYMHNPDTFGFLQFAEEQSEPRCNNVEWPLRFLLAQIYQAQVQYIIATGLYSAKLEDLVGNESFTYCNIFNGCYLSTLKLIQEHPSELQLSLSPANDATTCVKYTSPTSPFGGKCFTAVLTHVLASGHEISGSITESRRIQVQPHDTTLCLQEPESFASDATT